MAMNCSKSLASMLVSLLLLQVQPLRNVEYGSQLGPYPKTFFRDHHPIYICHPPQHIVPPRNDGVQSSNPAPSHLGRMCFTCGLTGHYFRQCHLVLVAPCRPSHKPSKKSTSRPLQAKPSATSSGCVNQIS